ncbi:lens intrinsic membrane protein 2.3 isoform X1 [Carassius carassius]|uniref:lens intrinsic membrane protein 2.3 isoform X1 n=1 Tax=Carassius carassius TaxID=217509 RepID=UPI0028686660|nr:lens intrinsic membrane protein 2.3 isoform X1 [Carassius carassius]
MVALLFISALHPAPVHPQKITANSSWKSACFGIIDLHTNQSDQILGEKEVMGNILLVISTATDYWMQYRQSSSYMHQGLWRYCVPGKCMTYTDSIAYWDATRAFMILAILACFFGIIIGVMAFINYSSFSGFDKTFAAGILYFISCFFVLLAMAVYTGMTVNYYGKRYGNWRFSWSYIMGWVSVVLTFFSGIFYMCAYRMYEPRGPMSR